MEIVNGCQQSARKAGQQKTVERLVEEAQNLPAPTVPAAFEKSEYVRALRVKFRRNPIHFFCMIWGAALWIY
jgi:hypothetical protein